MESNRDSSKEQRIFLEKQGLHLDGPTGDVIVRYKISPYLKEKIIKGELTINGVYTPTETDPEIEALLEIQVRAKLKGKTLREADISELLEAGILQL